MEAESHWELAESNKDFYRKKQWALSSRYRSPDCRFTSPATSGVFDCPFEFVSKITETFDVGRHLSH